MSYATCQASAIFAVLPSMCHIPLLFLFNILQDPLTVWWTVKSPCRSMCRTKDCISLHQGRYLARFFTLEIGGSCWSSDNLVNNLQTRVIALCFLDVGDSTRLHLTALVWLFTTRAVLHSAAVSLRESTSRVFKVNGLSRSLSRSFALMESLKCLFRRSKLMHTVMDYWKAAWRWFYEGFDMIGRTCFFFFLSFRDSSSAPNAGDTKAHDTVAVLKVKKYSVLFLLILRPEKIIICKSTFKKNIYFLNLLDDILWENTISVNLLKNVTFTSTLSHDQFIHILWGG